MALLACLLPLPRVATAAAAPSEASNLLGMTVVDARNKRLGVVTDLAVNLDKAQIVALRVGHNTADGMVNDVFPWSQVQVRDDKVVVGGTPFGQDVPEAQSLAKILHAPLRDAEGKAAGEIENLMVGFDDGKVALYIIHFDPKWLDMAAPAAVPLSSVERKDDGFVAKFSAANVRPAGGSKPIAAPPPPPQVHLARLSQVPASAANVTADRRLLQARFVNPAGNVVGKVEEVIVDTDDGKPKFMVASFVGDWVAAGWLVILPMRPLAPDKDGQPAMRITLNEINNAFLFEGKNWPDFSNPAVRAAIHAKIDHM
jgi:sporulation protein YlmC with PRC-barrel domain